MKTQKQHKEDLIKEMRGLISDFEAVTDYISSYMLTHKKMIDEGAYDGAQQTCAKLSKAYNQMEEYISEIDQIENVTVLFLSVKGLLIHFDELSDLVNEAIKLSIVTANCFDLPDFDVDAELIKIKAKFDNVKNLPLNV